MEKLKRLRQEKELLENIKNSTLDYMTDFDQFDNETIFDISEKAEKEYNKLIEKLRQEELKQIELQKTS